MNRTSLGVVSLGVVWTWLTQGAWARSAITETTLECDGAYFSQ